MGQGALAGIVRNETRTSEARIEIMADLRRTGDQRSGMLEHGQLARRIEPPHRTGRRHGMIAADEFDALDRHHPPNLRAEGRCRELMKYRPIAI